MRAASLQFFDAMVEREQDGLHLGLVLFTGDFLVHQDLRETTAEDRWLWEQLDYCEDHWDARSHETEHGLDCCAPTDCADGVVPDDWWLVGTHPAPALDEAVSMLRRDQGDGGVVSEHVVLLMDGEPNCWASGVIPECDAERVDLMFQAVDEVGLRADLHMIRGDTNSPVLARNNGVQCIEDWESCMARIVDVIDP